MNVTQELEVFNVSNDTTISISVGGRVLGTITYTDKPGLTILRKVPDSNKKSLVYKIQRKRTTCTVKSINPVNEYLADDLIKKFSVLMKSYGYRTITAFVDREQVDLFRKEFRFPLYLSLYKFNKVFMYRPI